MEIGKRIPGSRRTSHLAVLCLWLQASVGHPPVVSRDHLRVSGAVARQCQPVLSSAAQLTPHAAVQDLHFANGDWHQDAGHAPLMPVPADGGGGDVVAAGPGLLQQVTPLATFTLTHVSVQQQRQRQRSLNVTGVLSLTIRRTCCCSDDKSELMDLRGGRRLSPEFKLDPRVAKLDILLEGVYMETASDNDGGDGERVLCMVGNALLPMRGGGGGGGGNTTGPWDWAKNVADGSMFEPPVVADDNIVLILRYPKVQTLTTWAVHGEMMSTRAKSDNVYFDTVRLVSQFGDRHASYRFRPETEKLAAIAGCSTSGGGCAEDLHEDVTFCDIVGVYEHRVLAVVPNWNCDSTEEFCGRVGLFVNLNATGRAFTDFAIVMQGVQCKQRMGRDDKEAAVVSAVFRAVQPWEDLSETFYSTSSYLGPFIFMIGRYR